MYGDELRNQEQQPKPSQVKGKTYTYQDLLEAAHAVDAGISLRTLRAWDHEEGLLPEHISTAASAARRGRPQVQFPESAAGAVQALARWRRYVNDTETARVWLWLEGYDYLPVDTVQLQGSVIRWIDGVWEQLQQEIAPLRGVPILSGLGKYGDGPIPRTLSDDASVNKEKPEECPKDAIKNEEVIDDLNDALDRQVVQHLAGMSEDANVLQGIAMLVQGMVGFGLNRDEFKGTQTTLNNAIAAALSAIFGVKFDPASFGTEDELINSLMHSNIGEVAEPLFEIPSSMFPQSLYRWPYSKFIPEPVVHGRHPRAGIDWPVVRFLWRRICDASSEGLQQDVTRITSIADGLRFCRRFVYRHRDGLYPAILFLNHLAGNDELRRILLASI